MLSFRVRICGFHDRSLSYPRKLLQNTRNRSADLSEGVPQSSFRVECPHGIYGSDKQGLDMTGPGEVNSMLVVHIMISIIKWRWKASCGPTAHTRRGIVSVRKVCDEAAQNKAVKAW